jgi:predicted nucleic acid-binding protein
VLLDTSTLLRTLQPLHPQRDVVRCAIKTLTARGKELHIVPQNLVELWAVATRSVEHNGLGMPPARVVIGLTRLKGMFFMLPETPAIYPAWENLVIQHHALGKTAHDARLVAAMQVHGLTAILTFDKTGFSRYPGIEVVHADAVLA